MDWLIIVGGLLLGSHLAKKYPSQPSRPPARTIWSVRKAYQNNLKMINRLPLGPEERDAAREAARQKMLRDLDELMG